MEKKEYEILFNLEGDYWWHVGLRNLVFSYVDKCFSKKRNLRTLDAGCGTGKLLEECKDYDAYGLDFSEEALKFCKLRNLKNLVRGSISATPFKSDSFDTVISLDVLYYITDEENISTLKELYRIINKNGKLLLNLPAYNFLQSTHDKAVHIKQRYAKKNLKEKIEKAGFNMEKITYRNTILFPIAVIMRVIKKFFLKNRIESDLKPLPVLFNKIFTLILNIENRLILSGINFPFGLSLFCIARKNKTK